MLFQGGALIFPGSLVAYARSRQGCVGSKVDFAGSQEHIWGLWLGKAFTCLIVFSPAHPDCHQAYRGDPNQPCLFSVEGLQPVAPIKLQS